MKKFNKKSKEGIVDLNQAKFEENKQARPKVAANQKVPSPKKSEEKTDSKQTMPTISKENKKLKPIGNVKNFTREKTPFLNRDENGKLLLTRRNVIYGAIGAGGLLAAASGVKFATDTFNNALNSIDTLSVAKSNVIKSDDFGESTSAYMKVINEITLPYGSLAWANSSNQITCLIPSDKAKPLATVEAINLNNGNQSIVLSNSIGQKEGYEIYDARMSDSGIIWTEVNILQGEWRIYASSFGNNYKIYPTLIDKGASDWETPTIAITDNYAYWQVLPAINGSKNTILSSLKKVSLSNIEQDTNMTESVETNEDVKCCKHTIFTSNGRMASPVYPYNEGVVITPRANSGNVYYQLTYINNDDKVVDSLALPQNMKPIEAGYGNTGFCFAFDAIYNYGEGISNLGTYTPIAKNKNYSDSKWLNFSRNPSAAPAWCGDYMIVRSTLAVCALNLKDQNYYVLERPNASDDYGDYLASSGNCQNIVTFANIFDQPVVGDEKKYCLMRIWAPN